MKNYFALSAPQITNGEIDFSPVRNALAGYQEQQRQMQQDKLAAENRQYERGRQAQADQRQVKADQLAEVERLGKMAVAYDQLTDPTQRQAGLNKILALHPNAGSLTDAYRDPNKAFKLIAAEAGQYVDPYQKQKQQMELQNTQADTEYKKSQAAKNYQEASMGSVPKLTATDRKMIDEANDMVNQNQAAIDQLEYAKGLNKKTYAGWGASARTALGNNLPDIMVPDFIASPQGAADTTTLETTLVSNALQQLKTIFGGQPSEGERKLLLEVQGSINQPVKVREEIINRAMSAAKNKLRQNQDKLEELRGGTFYKPRQPNVEQANTNLKAKYGLE